MQLNGRSILPVVSFFVLVFVPFLAHALPDSQVPEAPPGWDVPWELPSTEQECTEAVTHSDAPVEQAKFEAWVSYWLARGGAEDIHNIQTTQIAHYIRIFPEIPKNVKEALLKGLRPDSLTTNSKPYPIVSNLKELAPLVIAVSRCEALNTSTRIQILRNLSRFLQYVHIVDQQSEQRNEQVQRLSRERYHFYSFLWGVLLHSARLQEIYEEMGGNVPAPKTTP